jgi:hypothetical protein
MHYHNALRAKVSQFQELLMGKRFTYMDEYIVGKSFTGKSHSCLSRRYSIGVRRGDG